MNPDVPKNSNTKKNKKILFSKLLFYYENYYFYYANNCDKQYMIDFHPDVSITMQHADS
jgi:hypothetical protein